MATGDELSVLTDELTRRQPLDCEKVYRFCEMFIASNQSFVVAPYIVGDSEPNFQTVPQRHEERIGRLKSYWDKESSKRQTEETSAVADDTEEVVNLPEDAIEALASRFFSIKPVTIHLGGKTMPSKSTKPRQKRQRKKKR